MRIFQAHGARSGRSRMLASAIAAALLLTACGGDDNGDEEAADGDDTSTEEPDDEGDDGGDDDGEVVTLSWSQVLPGDDPYHDVGLFLEERIQEYTDGGYEFEFFLGGALGDEITTLDMYGTGEADIGIHSSSSVASVIPEMGFLATPFLFESVEHWRDVMENEEQYSYWEGVLEENDASFRLGAYGTYGARNVYCVDQAIQSVEDFQGLRLRIIENPVQQRVWSEIGADPVILPYADVYSGLEAGIIDCAENAPTGMVQPAHQEVVDHYTYTQHEIAQALVFMSQSTYDELPEEDQEAFDMAFADLREEMVDIFLESVEPDVEAVEAEVENHDFPDEARAEVLDIVEPIHDEEAESLGLEDLLERIREAGTL